MSAGESMESGELPLSVRAEAAAWLASLGGPHRTPELEVRFGRWLAESEPHRIAWERVSDAWDLAGGLAAKIVPREEPEARNQPEARAESEARDQLEARAQRAVREQSAARRRVRPRGILRFAAVALLAGAAAAWVLLLSRGGAVSTGTGERRVLSLQDGSRITLNTDTRLVVRYDTEARRVRLERGEALFEVRRAPSWPFIVTAGGREIRALGTAFEVRRYGEQQVSITLVEGRISVAPAGAGARLPRQEVTVLASPGQRVTFTPHEVPRLDKPVLKQVIAWQSGEVVFDDTRLSDAAEEMNRYSERRIVIEEPSVASLRVSGLFQAGDSLEFAQGVAETFGLRVESFGSRIVLARQDQAQQHRAQQDRARPPDR